MIWRLVATQVAVGCAAATAGMVIYPGGNRFDHEASGYDFWRNFLCDGTNPVAINGAPNPVGSHLLQFGLLMLATCFLPLWLALPRLVTRGGAPAAVVKWAGFVGTLHMLPVIAAAHTSRWHDLVYIGGPLCIAAIATFLAELAFEWRAYVPLFSITAGLAGTAALNLYFYAHNTGFGAHGLPDIAAVEVSALQKVVSILGVCWLVAAAGAVTRLHRDPATTQSKLGVRTGNDASSHGPTDSRRLFDSLARP